MRFRDVAIVVGLALAGGQVAAGAAFSNGSFELPDASTVSDRVNLTKGTFLTGSSGWQETDFTNADSGSAIYSKANPQHTNDFVKPSNGNQFIALNLTGGTNNTGGVQQVFDTVPGQLYNVSFDFSAISNGDSSTQRASYEVDNGAVAATTATAGTVLVSGQASRDTTGFNNLTMALPYATTSFSFTALSTSSTIRFVSLTSPPSHNAFGPVVDNVQVTPEPAALSLLTIAAAGLLARRRRGSVSA